MEKTLPTSPSALFDDLLRLPIREEMATSVGMPTQGYAILLGDRSLLVDAVDELHLKVIEDLMKQGKKPAAVVLTHVHLVEYKAALRALHEDLGLPVLLHPRECEAESAKASGVRFDDPMESALLSAFGVTAEHFPGHTPGHIVLLWSGHGGALFTGDCAVGPRPAERLAGVDTPSRPPPSLSVNDELLRQSWLAFDHPIEHILPLHGEPLVGRGGAPRLTALRRAETSPDLYPGRGPGGPDAGRDA